MWKILFVWISRPSFDPHHQPPALIHSFSMDKNGEISSLSRSFFFESSDDDATRFHEQIPPVLLPRTQFSSFIAVTIYINRIEGIWIPPFKIQGGSHSEWTTWRKNWNEKQRKADFNKQKSGKHNEERKNKIRDGISHFYSLWKFFLFMTTAALGVEWIGENGKMNVGRFSWQEEKKG